MKIKKLRKSQKINTKEMDERPAMKNCSQFSIHHHFETSLPEVKTTETNDKFKQRKIRRIGSNEHQHKRQMGKNEKRNYKNKSNKHDQNFH